MIKKDIEAILKPLIVDLGYELWGFDYLSQGKHSLLRLYIDKEGGVTIDDCERVSKQVSALLDVEDPISGNYNLEVSSPGIPRPLFYKEQYKRYLGQLINLKVISPIEGSRKFSGTILNVGEDILTIKV